MLKKYICPAMILLLFSGLTGCLDNDGIGNIEKPGLLQFDFPQGNNPWDEDIRQISEEWGMYIIYKDIDSTHLNRMWTTPVYYDPIYVGNPVREQDIPVYLEFVTEWLLATLDVSKVEDREQLPFYFYFINDLDDGNPRSSTYQNNHIQIKKDGLDYWSLSFTTEELDEGLSSEKIHNAACAFSYPGIKIRFQTGEYEMAPGFIDLSDYETPIGREYISFEEWRARYPNWSDALAANYYPQLVQADQRDEKNFYLRRGFAPVLSENFRFQDTRYNNCPQWMSWVSVRTSVYNPTNNPNANNIPGSVEERALEDFLNMMRLAMYYTEERMQEEFPVDVPDQLDQAGHGLILEKYRMVVEHMQETYGIDLPRYAAILE